ncbi:MAG: agmatine deiminase family protein [Magnetococcales bacterium]|nr:agmatine deiminase family protein [Magnetococcales bacterium]
MASLLLGMGVLLMVSAAQAELIVLAAPKSEDRYYADVIDEIYDFHVAFARRIEGRDRVVVLTDREGYDDYVEALGPERVAVAPMEDIWMRDFGTANPDAPVMFRYSAEGQGGGDNGQRDADAVQEVLAVMAEKAGVRFQESDLLNDGGNLVDDGDGRVVLSRKFLRDNRFNEEQGRAAVKRMTGARYVAFIEADEQGGLEHADGVVSFIGPNLLIVNSYPDDPDYRRKLHEDLQRGLPGVKIHEIVTPYDGNKIYDERFGSACGLYTNALVTPHRIYLPQFGIPDDHIAIEQLRSITDREIVPVPAHQVCFMGGGVRCMSWQLRGRSADRLMDYLGRVR